MTRPPPTAAELKADRWVRASSYAAFAFAIWSLLWLPMPLLRDEAGWHLSWRTLIQVPLCVLAGVYIRRGVWYAIALAGIVGFVGVGQFGLAIVRVLDGTEAASYSGPSWVIAAAIAALFSIWWSLAAVVLIRRWMKPTVVPTT